MSPFSTTLKALREVRNLKQKEAAEMLGVEQSFISSLERGHKTAPKKGFIELVANKYQLTIQEIDCLGNALNISKHNYILSPKAPAEVFEIFNELEKQAIILNHNQINLMKLALGLEEIRPNQEPQMEVPKM